MSKESEYKINLLIRTKNIDIKIFTKSILNQEERSNLTPHPHSPPPPTKQTQQE